MLRNSRIGDQYRWPTTVPYYLEKSLGKIQSHLKTSHPTVSVQCFYWRMCQNYLQKWMQREWSWRHLISTDLRPASTSHHGKERKTTSPFSKAVGQCSVCSQDRIIYIYCTRYNECGFYFMHYTYMFNKKKRKKTSWNQAADRLQMLIIYHLAASMKLFYFIPGTFTSFFRFNDKREILKFPPRVYLTITSDQWNKTYKTKWNYAWLFFQIKEFWLKCWGQYMRNLLI